MRQITYVRPDGRPIAVLDADLLMGRRDDDLEIMRTDLTRILYATAADVEYVFGDAIATLTEDRTAWTSPSTAARPGGSTWWSAPTGCTRPTRRLAMGEVPLRHLGAYISIFTMPNHLGLDREEVFLAGPAG